MWALFKARNHEFFRDRAAFGWNFLFPFLIVAGFATVFGGEGRTDYKIGVFPCKQGSMVVENLELPEPFKETRYLAFIPFETKEEGLEKLKHHRIDFLLENDSKSHRYWVSESSPKGYIIERVFNAALAEASRGEASKGEGEISGARGEKSKIQGREIRYIDWLFPGILGMNMMFSALWGVGYIVVRYRRIGVLKRFKATPLTALEYLSSQMLSRIYVLMFTIVVVWFGCDLVFSFQIEGSLVDIFLIFLIGSLSLTSMGLILAARGTSEEFTTGILNFISWPMMFLSEVWFSLEGAPQWLKMTAKIFPLTHILSAARKVMNDGAGLLDVSFEISILAVMTIVFLIIGSSLFSWTR